MGKPNRSWKVSKHGPLRSIGERLLTVEGTVRMPIGAFPRRMTAAKLADGTLAIFSAVALDEPSMQRLERFGTPRFLVVPSELHRMDVLPWKERYPQLLVVAPPAGRAKVESLIPVDATGDVFVDPRVSLDLVAGTQDSTLAMQVQDEDGTTLVLGDLIGNIQDSRGIGGFFLRAMRFAGAHPQVPRPVRPKDSKDREALRRQFLRWSELPGLRRILVAHGKPIEQNPAGVLRGLAASLAPARRAGIRLPRPAFAR